MSGSSQVSSPGVDRDSSDTSEPIIEPTTRFEETHGPLCPPRTELGSTIDVWNWLLMDYLVIYRTPQVGTAVQSIVPSPYFQLSDNTDHLANPPNGTPRDFALEAGWELLYQNFGTNVRPVTEPSFGLYNRLDGRVRIHFAIDPDFGIPDNATLSLSHVVNGGNTSLSAVFETLNLPMNAISNFDHEQAISGMTRLNQGTAGSNWYILEGVFAYDPCVCGYESQLRVRPYWSGINKLIFSMTGTGTSDAIYDAGSPIPTLGYINKGASKPEKVLKGFKSYDEDSYADDAASNVGQTVDVFQSLLGGANSILPHVKNITSLLGFVTGTKLEATPPKIVGFNHNFEFTAVGEITDSDPYGPHTIYTPGSRRFATHIDDEIPTYDNPVGVFAILTPPVVQRERFERMNGVALDQVTRWRYTGDLRYHVNSTGGLQDQPIQLLASLVWTDCDNPESFYATPAINVTCLEEFMVEHVAGFISNPDCGGKIVPCFDEFNAGCIGPPVLQIVAVIPSQGDPENQQTLYSARYITEVVDVEPGTIVGSEFTDASVSDISLSCPTTVPPPVDGEYLDYFCSSVYGPIFSEGLVEPTIPAAYTKKVDRGLANDFRAFPNPFVGEITVAVPSSWYNETVELALTDVLGRTVHRATVKMDDSGQILLSKSIGALPSGSYLLSLSSDKGRHTLTLQK